MAEAQYCDVKPLIPDDDNDVIVALSYGRDKFPQLAIKVYLNNK